MQIRLRKYYEKYEIFYGDLGFLYILFSLYKSVFINSLKFNYQT